MTDTGKNASQKQRAKNSSSGEKPAAVGLLPMLKNLNELQVSADMNGHEFLSYLLKMAIMEAQALASRGGDAGSPNRK